MDRKKKQAAIVAAIILIIGVILVAAISSPKKSAQRAGGAPGMGISGDEKSEAKSVRASVATVKTLKPYIDVNGDVEAKVNVAVYPDIGGKLVAFTVAIGDSVNKGDTIARIDPSKPGSNYAISPVIAPITGTVTAIDVDQGATVTTATALASVGIIDDLKIVVNLAERDSAKAAKGMTATVSFEALPNETFAATVTRVSPVLDPTSRSREITLELAGNDRRISAGMYAKIRLYTSPVPGKVVVPQSAVVTQNGEACAFVVKTADGKSTVTKRAVKTGTAVDADVAIIEGIDAGDLVVSEGQSGLSDGATVSILSEAAK